VIGSAVVVWFAIYAWNDPTPDTSWLVVAAVALVIVAAFVIAEPRFAPAPMVVPARETLDTAPTAVAAAAPMRLGVAMHSAEYLAELATRRSQLEPEGPWATWWAKRFHGWQPPTDTTSAAPPTGRR